MRSVRAVRTVTASPEAAFDRVADFASTAEWDPGVTRASRDDDGPLGVGSRFTVHARFLGQTVPMDYQITTFDRPKLLVLRALAERSTATDTIRFRQTDHGTEVDWTLDLQLLGASRLAEPFLGPVLRRLARAALDGLVADLSNSARQARVD